MFHLSQRDSRWSSFKLGASTLTVGRYGCTTTCISMLTSYFGVWHEPATLASNKSNYTRDGLVLWEAMSKNLKSMKFVERVYGRNDKKIQDSLKNPKTGVILQVDNGAHWILPIYKLPFVNDYICIDPWDGKYCRAISKYRNITGSAHFKAK